MDKVDNIMGGTKVAVAHEHKEIALKVYDDYVEEMLNNGISGFEWDELDRLAKIANDADTAWLAAKDAALNECYCTEAMAEACAVCLADSRRRHGDEIPFMEGEL